MVYRMHWQFVSNENVCKKVMLGKLYALNGLHYNYDEP